MLLTPIPAFMPQAANANSAAYTNFIARTSGLDATHLTAYAGLLNGLTTDGLFNSDGTSSYLDVLYVFATQDATTARLNLISSSYNATLVVTPTFTADQGYSNLLASGQGLNTNFNPTTAGGHYVQNAACMGVWAYNTPTDGAGVITAAGASSGAGQNIYPNFSGSTFFRINDSSGGFTLTSSAGFFFGNRSSSTARQAYKNKVSVGTYGSTASSALDNSNLFIQGRTSDYIARLSAAVFGGSLNSTQSDALYDRLRTYLTAVGVP